MSNNVPIVPVMDTPTITRLDTLQEHLHHLSTHPDDNIDKDLIDHVCLQVNSGNTSHLLPLLFPPLLRLLQTHTHDPHPLAHLATKLIQSSPTATLTTLRTALIPNESSLEPLLIAGLTSPSPTLNNLSFAVLRLATHADSPDRAKEPAQVEQTRVLLTQTPGLVDTLLKTWLTTPHTGTATQAGSLIHTLLVNDPTGSDPRGPWHRFLGRLGQLAIFELVWATGPDASKEAKDQQSLAQSRLLEFLPAVVRLNPAIPIQPPLGHSFGARPVGETYNGDRDDGLLHVAAFHMVGSDDTPMVMLLTRFWEQLVLSLDAAGILEPGADGEVALRYSRLLAAGVSYHESEGQGGDEEIEEPTISIGQRVAEALAALPGKFEDKEDEERIRGFMRRMFVLGAMGPGGDIREVLRGEEGKGGANGV